MFPVTFPIPNAQEGTMSNWNDLVSRFRNQTLQKSEWTHAAHLVVALWHLLEYESIEQALCYLRPGIILFNHSVGIMNTDGRGYHETITVFWTKQVYAFIQRRESRAFDVLAEELLAETAFFDKDFILHFYSREALKTPRARGSYVSP